MEHSITRTIFIGTASEDRNIGLSIQRAINQYNNSNLPFNVHAVYWENVLNTNSPHLLQNIIEYPNKYDYGIFLFTPNDTVTSRNDVIGRVRDNVLFEFGLFASKEDGLKKSFIIHPNNMKLKLASDLEGMIFAKYRYHENPEFLEGYIQEAVNTIIESIKAYEKKIMDDSEKYVKDNIANLKTALQDADDSIRPAIILDSLKSLATKKAKAMNQSASEVLTDILTWTNNLLDILDPFELANHQGEGLKEVWVYSSFPLEFNNKIKKTQTKFLEVVEKNLKNNVKYIYLTDSDKTVKNIKNTFEKYLKNIEIYKIKDYCMLSNFVFHFYDKDDFNVYQNIVRREEIASLVKLDFQDAIKIKNKVEEQKKIFNVKKKA